MPRPPVVDRALLEHLAELARLKLPAERQAVLRQQLQQLVAAFSALADAPLPAAGPERRGEPSLRLRDDRAEAPPPVAAVLANAPQHASDCFVVPRVLDP